MTKLAFDQMHQWKSTSAKLFLSWSISGVKGWCVGTLQHVSEAELHFGIPGIDGKDFLFVINVHPTYGSRFQFVDNRDAWQFFAPQREKDEFGKALEIALRGDSPSEIRGKVILAEVFSTGAIESD
jgi:hypothetical protein